MSLDTSICFLGFLDSDSPRKGPDSGQSHLLSASRKTFDLSRKYGRTLQSIPTSEILEEDLSAAELIFSPEASLASHLVLPGSDEARQMTASSGLKCSELFKRQTPIGSLVRTLLASTDWASTIVFLTWKPAATKSRRRLKFQLVPLAHPTKETEFGLLPTPLASDFRDRGNVGNPSIKRRMLLGKQIHLSMLFKGTPCPMCVASMMGFRGDNLKRFYMPSETLSSHKSRIKSSKRSKQKSTKPKDEARPF